MNLVIDQGNTATKYAVFNAGGNLLHAEQTADVDPVMISALSARFEIKYVFVSSVRKNYDELRQQLKIIEAEKLLFFDDSCQLPVKISYSTPKTLGKDRIAGVCGARFLYPDTNCLVIDAGTCITYDFIDKEGTYHGGSISPGLEMRLKAMHHFTGKLPLVHLRDVKEFTGDSTETSLLTGAIFGAMHEINGFIQRYTSRWPHTTTIICGGNANFLADRVESEIFAVPDIVLSGLNQILAYNITHGA